MKDGDEVKVLANWDDEKHYIWLKICLEEARDGHKKNATLGAKGYENLIRKFEEQTNIRYTRALKRLAKLDGFERRNGRRF